MDVWIDCGRYRTVVDESDNWLTAYRWHTHGDDQGSNRNVYACHTFSAGAKAVHVYLHHFLLPKVAGLDVDHRDFNSLNNRRANLRHLPHGENVTLGWRRKRRADRGISD